MAVGDVDVTRLEVGAMDFTDPQLIQYEGFSVREDLYNPYGPSAEIKAIDFRDLLGITNLNGDQDIFIDFRLPDFPGRARFEFKCFENRDLIDRAEVSALKHKEYEIRCISEEYLQCQARPNVQKSYNMPISRAIEDLVKNTGFMSKKAFICDDPTKGNVKHVATGHPIHIYQQLNELAVSMKNKSSAYVLFVQDGRYVYTTIEELCKKSPVIRLVQDPTLGADSTEEQRLNSITHIKVSRSFFTPPRAKSLTMQATYDTTTGKATYPMNPAWRRFIHLGNPVFSENSVLNRVLYGQKSYTRHDRANNKTSTDIAEARQNRAAYIAYLAQNEAELIIPGNPRIKLGNVIHITIPNKSTEHYNGTELQFSGEVLVTEIIHTIRGTRYTMKLKVNKAGGYDRGGVAG